VESTGRVTELAHPRADSTHQGRRKAFFRFDPFHALHINDDFGVSFGIDDDIPVGGWGNNGRDVQVDRGGQDPPPVMVGMVPAYFGPPGGAEKRDMGIARKSCKKTAQQALIAHALGLQGCWMVPVQLSQRRKRLRDCQEINESLWIHTVPCD